MPLTPIITDFSAGELSGKVLGRTDLQLYTKGMMRALNWQMMPQGGITMRPGTVHVATITGTGVHRIIPYIVNNDLSYVLEFGANYIELWKVTSAGVVLLTGEGFPLVTTFTAAELPEIQFAQDEGGLYLVHRSHTPKKIAYTGGDAFTFGPITFSGVAGDIPFQTSGNYPGCVAIFGGRMWYASSTNEPQKIWASVPWSYADFSWHTEISYSYEMLTDHTGWADPEEPESETVEETRDQITESNAFNFEIGSKASDRIQHMTSADELIIGTEQQEWAVPWDVSALLPRAKIKTGNGSADLQPELVGDSVLFFQGAKKQFLEYRYTDERNNYAAPELTMFADHLFADNTAVEYAHQREPFKNVYVVRSDGVLCTLLYDSTAGVIGWARWQTNGGTDGFESICVVPQAGVDLVFTVVSRVNGDELEYFAPAFASANTSALLADSMYDVTADDDSLLVGNNLTCDWLADYTNIAIIQDGFDVATKTANGSGVIDMTGYLTGQVYVGIRYSAEFESMPIDPAAQYGVTALQEKRLLGANLRLYRSQNLSADTESFTPASMQALALNDPETNGWYTGDEFVPVDGDWETQATLRLVNDKAEPCTILAIVPVVEPREVI